MSRLQTAFSKSDIECIITTAIFFDPVMTHCGQHVERTANARLKRCPCCNSETRGTSEASHFFKNALQAAIAEYNLYEDVYFNPEDFEKIVKEDKLKTPMGERYLTLLQNTSNHLNHKPVIRTETQTTHPAYLQIPEVTITETFGKSAIEILTSTLASRDLLRKKLKIETGKFFFGNAEISAGSLQTQVNGKSIREWLSMTTAMEIMQEEEQKARQAMHDDAEKLQTQFSRTRLFLSRGAQGAAAGQRISSDAVNPILQQVVYGNENAVKTALEAAKSNATQLSGILSDTGTGKDYSDRTITGMTLLQAAAAAGDIEMCLMLKNYMAPEEFVCQLAEIFPEDIDEQQRNTFNFDAILTAIRSASTPDLDAALNKIGAEFTQSDSARAKSDRELSLIEALNRFREQFTQHSHSEKIFNPHHLLKAFEVYNALWDQCDVNETIDPDHKKRDLFWRQIIGYIQRFMPACFAQAFAQGLYYLVKVDQDASWRPETFKRDLKLSGDTVSYFPLPRDSRSGLGFDFAIWGGGAAEVRTGCCVRGCGRRVWPAALWRFFQKLLSSKNNWLSELYAANARAVTDVGTFMRNSVM